MERRHRCRGGIYYMHEARYALAVADYRDLLLAHLLTHIAFAGVPGARPVKESVAESNAFYPGAANATDSSSTYVRALAATPGDASIANGADSSARPAPGAYQNPDDCRM